MDDLLRHPLGAQRAHPAAPLAALAVAFTLLLAGCGGGDAGTDGESELPAAGGAGTLTYAVPALPATLDPLTAEGHTALTVTRQIHEPLIAQLTGPYGDMRRQPGLALSAEPSDGGTVWTLTLRPSVRFQDGTPLNGAAVLANARRWGSAPAGQRLLPDLFAVDAPRPDQVRFLLDQPVQDLPRRLSSPRLGIVSPRAARYGTGPFELGGVSPGRIELSRFAGWWGSGVGLGPALDGVVFLGSPREPERRSLLQAGTVQVADPLGAAGLAAVEADPLLSAIGGPVTGIGLEGSVRGFGSARAVPVLSRVWLTDIPG